MYRLALVVLLGSVVVAQDKKEDVSFSKVIANSIRQKAYAWKISHGAEKKASVAFEGEYASGVLHIKYGDLELARKDEAAFAWVGKDWKPLADVLKDGGKIDADKIGWGDLYKFSPPARFLEQMPGYLTKVKPDSATSPTQYSGELTETAVRALLKEKWIIPEEPEWSNLSGTGTISFYSTGLVTQVELKIQGTIPSRSTRRGRPRIPPTQVPKYGTTRVDSQGTHVTLIVTLSFDEYGKAQVKVPEDILKKLAK